LLNIANAWLVYLAMCTVEDAWRWHAHFSHISFGALHNMGREELVRGLPALAQAEQICEACLTGKHRRMPFPHLTPATPSGNRYFLLLVGDYSRYIWVVLLHTKYYAPAAIKRV
jgi:hypothetical protein